MSNTKLKVAILGFGGRGKMYAQVIKGMPAEYTGVAVIDTNPEKLAVAKDLLDLDDNALFANLDDFLAAPKVADYLFVCTQDKDHILHAIPALKAGYHLLLEKPIACSVQDCLEIEKVAKEYDRKVAVCHVLRYSAYYEKIKELMQSGVIGKIIAIDQVENVGYWHQSHSFVRGDWRRKDESTPMILAKCCHDLDIAVFLADSQCEQVSSVGKNYFFNKDNAPQGATEYCVGGCKAKKDCPYDCEKLYINNIRRLPKRAIRGMWPQSRLMSDGIVTIPKLEQAIRETRYGKCVFLSDNDVVDYEVATMQFANGIASTLTMTAFSNRCYRETRIRGTLGELVCNMDKGLIILSVFGKKDKKVRLLGMDAHGGGDRKLIAALAKGTNRTDITMSIESHLIAFAAEESRLQDGKPIKIDTLRK